jgi:hypothetical protein
VKVKQSRSVAGLEGTASHSPLLFPMRHVTCTRLRSVANFDDNLFLNVHPSNVHPSNVHPSNVHPFNVHPSRLHHIVLHSTMPASIIKKEDSPELFIAETPPTSAAESTMSSIAASASPIHGGADVKPPKAWPNSTVPQARSAKAYRDNYKINSKHKLSVRHLSVPVCTLLSSVLSRLASCLP